MPKPVKKKKKFISKKNATTYHLIPGFTYDEDDNAETPEQVEERKEEQRQYGIFYDDGYNYMKHLRATSDEATMVNADPSASHSETQSSYGGFLPFREFFSTDETPEDKIDEDVLAALEDAPEVKLNDMDMDDSESLLKDKSFLSDDFINQAGGVVPNAEMEEFDDSDRDFSFDEEDEGSDFDGEDEEDDEADDNENYLQQPSRSRSNVHDDIIEAQTALILKNFEEGLGFSCAAQDDDVEMPKVEDYEGLKVILNQDKFKDRHVSWSEVLNDHSDRPKIDTSKYEYEDDNDEEYEWKEFPTSKPKYDCVSILSLNSNTRNLPTDIIPPRAESKKSKKSSTSDSEHPPGISLKELEEEIRESRRADKASTFRPRDENKEEKKARKLAIKDERKERRVEKKANKAVFTIEKHKMHKETAALAKAGKGMKIS